MPFIPGRTDATQEWTDPDWFAVLEPVADGFRNYRSKRARLPSEHLLVDRASQLTLTAAEMTVLVGGLRALGVGHSGLGVLTSEPGTLSNDFFVNLLDLENEWTPVGEVFEGRDRRDGSVRWTASRADLVFGSHPELRAVAELYAADDAQELFARDFAAAWAKVMDLGRY